MARHRQAPGCVRIRVAVRAPPRASPPVAPASPAEGHFVCEPVRGGPAWGIARHSAACAFASLCVSPRARPLPLHRPASLRVIPLARAHSRRSRSHPPPKRCARDRVFASFRRIARERVCARFRYRFRVRKCGDIPRDIY